jgi:fructose-1,6-bisphosphatase/inositol monophosphatase family enzyme
MVLEICDEALEVDHCHCSKPATEFVGNDARVRADRPVAWFTAPVTADEILEVLHRAADRVVAALGGDVDWGPSGLRAGQYTSDLVADAAVLEVLADAGIRVLSEESGLGEGRGPVAVVDPLDGSTNAALGLPWFATSLCVVDDEGPWVAVVHDHASGDRFEAVRGGGARRNGQTLASRTEIALADAIVVVNGVPPAEAGWAQFRCMGATALDLCAVADGRFAAYIDFDGGLGVWDYLGALLVCAEVGVEMVDAGGRELVVVDHLARRSPIAAPSALLGALVTLRTGDAPTN